MTTAHASPKIEQNQAAPQLSRVEEAGRKLGIGRAAAYAHAKAGHIPVIRLGNRMLVPKAAFKRLLEKV
jgi:excisionase family DNA binding protein